MDEFTPFRETDRWEIRQVAKSIFYGGGITDDVILPFYKKWYFFFTLFDRIIEHKTGDYRHYPFNDDAANQPYRTMQVTDYMRVLWIEKLEADNKKTQ